MRHAAGALLANAGQPARDSSGVGEERTALLNDFNERDLKMMAQAFREVGKCRNFIRLYPTPATVKRYGPLMPRNSGAHKLLLRVLYGEEVSASLRNDPS